MFGLLNPFWLAFIKLYVQNTNRLLEIRSVRDLGGFGRLAFLEVTIPYDDVGSLVRATITRSTVH